MQETEKISNRFRVEEKLRYINSSKWGNKGAISVVDASIRRDHSDIQGGIDLSYFYPDRGFEVEHKQRIRNMGVSTRYRWVPKRTPSSLRVLATIDQRTGDKWIEVRSSRPHKKVPNREIGQNPVQESEITFDLLWQTIARIPVEGVDSEVLFNDALAKETIIRTAYGLPDQLERAGEEWLRRQDWGWGRWDDQRPFSGH